MPKISIDQIATWNSGEVLSESKYHVVFSLIGNAINQNYELLDEVIFGLKQLKIASRWIGQVSSFSQIESYINDNKNNEAFLPPNNPLPSLGDTILVDNNNDDPNFPNTLPYGRYMYIYTAIYSADQEKTFGWVYYNPFTLPLASRLNDGLLSREDYAKIQDLPSADELKKILDILNTNVELALTKSDEALTLAKSYESSIKQLQEGLFNLAINKQDKKTNLPGFNTKTVETNLGELKHDIDIFKNIKSKIMEDFQEVDNIYWNFLQEQSSTYPKELTLPYDLTLTLNNSHNPTVLSTYMEEVYKSNGALVFGFDLVSAISGSDITHTQFLTFKFDFTNGLSQNSDWVSNIVNFTTNTGENISLNLTLTLCAGFDKSSIFILRLNKVSQNSLTITQDMVDKYKLYLRSIFKDLGSSDYAISKTIKDDLINFLDTNLGLEQKIIKENIIVNQGQSFNGFLQGTIYDTGYSFLKSANSLQIIQGGIVLTRGVDYEEVLSPNPVYNNAIIFLRNIDINKDGFIVITIFNVSQTTVKYRIWDPITSWNEGDIAVYNGLLYLSIKDDNINHLPDEVGSIWWYPFLATVDLGILEERLKVYIDNILPGAVQQNVEQQLDAYTTGYRLLNYQGEVFSFNSNSEFLAFYQKVSSDKAYIYLNDVKTYLVDISYNIVYTLLDKQDTNGKYAYASLFNVFIEVLPKLEVLTATPDAVDLSVRAYVAGLTRTSVYNKQTIDTKLAEINSTTSGLSDRISTVEASITTKQDKIDATNGIIKNSDNVLSLDKGYITNSFRIKKKYSLSGATAIPSTGWNGQPGASIPINGVEESGNHLFVIHCLRNNVVTTFQYYQTQLQDLDSRNNITIRASGDSSSSVVSDSWITLKISDGNAIFCGRGNGAQSIIQIDTYEEYYEMEVK